MDKKLSSKNVQWKKRVGIYFKQNIEYVTWSDLEKKDKHIVICDILGSTKLIIINVYRSFRLPGGLSALEFFKSQLEVIKNALCSNCFIMGDFNLDGGMNVRQDYCARQLLDALYGLSNEANIIQVVNFNMWSRTINGVKKESLLNHVYTKNISLIPDMYPHTHLFGDHTL